MSALPLDPVVDFSAFRRFRNQAVTQSKSTLLLFLFFAAFLAAFAAFFAALAARFAAALSFSGAILS